MCFNFRTNEKTKNKIIDLEKERKKMDGRRRESEWRPPCHVVSF